MISQAHDIPQDLASLIRPIVDAIQSDRIAALPETLRALVTQGAFDRPEFYAAPRGDRYARRLVWRDPADRFILVGMTWGPCQIAPLHDHAGMWGCEVIVDGTMSETQYELIAREGDRYKFAPTVEHDLPPGTVGVLIPPLEHHDYGNRSSATVRTLHIYGGNLTTSQAFTNEGEWWRAKRVDLRYDN